MALRHAKTKAPRSPLSHLSSGTLGMLRDYGRAVSVGPVEGKERLALTLGLHIFKMTSDEKREIRRTEEGE